METLIEELSKGAKGAFQPNSSNFRDGKGYSRRKLRCFMLHEALTNSHDNVFIRKGTMMTKTIEDVYEEVDTISKKFEHATDMLVNKGKGVEDAAKTSSTKIRVSLDKVSGTIAQLNKSGNLDTLTRYANTLTDLADALERIAVIEKQGKLTSIVNALSGKKA